MRAQTLLHLIQSPLGVATPVVICALVAVSTASAQGLQADIDAAQPGDTVWVAPGDYTKTVTVNKAITLAAQGPGPSRLVGLTGSLATVAGIQFDGSVGQGPATLVTCGSGLILEDCGFSGSVRGAMVQSGAAGVVLRGCVFNDYIEALALGSGVSSLLLEKTDFLNCSVGINSADTLTCPGGSRAPAARCEDPGCGDIILDQVTFDGGDNQIRIRGDYFLQVTDCVFDRASVCALEAQGVRLGMTGTQITSVGGVGKGLLLRSVSGYITRSDIFFWDIGIDVGDGDCPLYSDLIIDNSIANAGDVTASLWLANDIGNVTWNLFLRQPERVEAEGNFWGTESCTAALAKISGQTVNEITNAAHTVLIDCSNTAVEPVTWGRLKSMYPGEAPDRP